MTRSEMVAAVRRLFAADGNEQELDQILDCLVQSVPHADISDLIYYPDKSFSEEEIVDEALRREQAYAAKIR